MKKTLLAGIAALLMATSAAHAESALSRARTEKYYCDPGHIVTREVVGETERTSDGLAIPLGGRYIFDLGFEYPRNQILVIRWNNKTQTLTLNGKRCRLWRPKDAP
jgi:hypothetical protein